MRHSKKKLPEYRLRLAREFRRESTLTEQRLWECLRNGRWDGYKFRRQHPLGRYIVDFYCETAKLVIEIDGEIHNEMDQQEYDQIRDEALTAAGCAILRIPAEDVRHRIPQAIDTIRKTLSHLLPPSEETTND